MAICPGRPAEADEAQFQPEAPHASGLPGKNPQRAGLRRCHRIAARSGAEPFGANWQPVFLKREDMQPVFSFKLRGAYNKIAKLSPEKLKRGVICASAGNHAQGVALSAQGGLPGGDRHADDDAADQDQAVQNRGGEVVLAGDSYDEAYIHALELEKKEKLTFVHPFDDPEVIAGQGTIGMEILRQHPQKPIHAVFCCVGGGGLIPASAPTSSACGRRRKSSASRRSMPMPWTVAEGRQARAPEAGRPVCRRRGGEVRSARKPSACASSTSTR
jgi:hypothetical protein